MVRRKRAGYSDGEINALVDGFIHPKARKDISWWAVDGLLHALVEGDPKVSAEKFVRFNMPKIIAQVTGIKYTKRPRKRFNASRIRPSRR